MQTTQQVQSATERGSEYLLRSIGPHGLQSHVSLDPKFSKGPSVPCARVLELPLPTQIKHRLKTLLTFQPEVFTSALALLYHKELPCQAKGSLLQWVMDKRLPHVNRYHFFSSPESIAADTDTTAVALLGMWQYKAITQQEFTKGICELLRSAATGKYENNTPPQKHSATTHKDTPLASGVFKCYWEDEASEPALQRGRKADAVVVLNVLRTILFAQQVLGSDLPSHIKLSEKDESGQLFHNELSVKEIIESNISHLRQHLRSGKVLQGTRYYPSPSLFVGLLADMIKTFPKTCGTLFEETQQALLTLLQKDPSQNSPLDLAMQLLALRRLELAESQQKERIERLLRTQQNDGSWSASTCFSLGSQPLYFGSSELTTIFVLYALATNDLH